MKTTSLKLVSLSLVMFATSLPLHAIDDAKQRLSASIVSFNANEFGVSGLDLLEDMSFALPNFSVSSHPILGSIAPIVTLRGSVDQGTNIFNSAKVGVYYNGAYLPAAQNALVNAASISSVTAAYGSNGINSVYSAGGSISYNTELAGAGEYYGFSGSIGSINKLNYTQIANVQLSPKAFARVVASVDNKASNINGIEDDKSYTAQASLVIMPTSKWMVNLSLDSIKSEIRNDVDITSITAVTRKNAVNATGHELLSAALFHHTAANNPSGIVADDVRIVTGEFFSPGYCLLDSNDVSYALRNTGTGSASVAANVNVIGLAAGSTYDFNGCENSNTNTLHAGKIKIENLVSDKVKVIYSVSVAEIDNQAVFDRTGLGISAEVQDINVESVQQDINVNYVGKYIDFTAGIVRRNESATERGINYGVVGTGTGNTNYAVAVNSSRWFVVETDSAQGFVHGSLKHNKWSFSLTGQIARDEISAVLRNSQIDSGSVRNTAEVFNSEYYRAALNYINDHVTLYVSGRLNDVPGGINNHADTDDRIYDKERVIAYEIGVKTRLLRKRLLLDFTAFQESYSDRHIYQRADDVTYISNLTDGEVRISGLEGTLRLIADDNLSFFVAMGASKHEITGGSNAGKSLPYVADINGHVGVDYVLPFEGYPMHINVTYAHIGEMATSFSNTDILPERSEIGVSVKYDVTQDLSFFFVCNNCSDQTNSSGIYSDGVVSTAYRANRRNVHAGVEYQF